MMNDYRLSRRAEADLDDIFFSGIELFGLPQALKYRDSLKRCFALLAQNPRMGRRSPTIRAGLRRHEHGSHVILYKDQKHGVLIVAIVHGRNVRRLKH